MTNIGDRIRDRRIRAGITAEQLAKKLHKSRATIYRYESSDAENMPISVLTPLAKALGTTPADLMGWEAPAAKATINDNSLNQDLFQYYIRRPKAVQIEILNRLKDMDITFSKNVSNLLQESGDINGFMQYTDLDFAAVGKLMQGEPIDVSSDEADKVAEFFNININELFFDTITTSPASDKGEQQNKGFTLIEDDAICKLHDTKTGYNLRPFFENFFENKLPTSLEHRCLELCSDEALDKFISRFISIETDRYGSEGLDYPRIYEIIAELIAQDPDGFMKKYVQRVNKPAARKILRTIVLDKLHNQ